MEKLIDNSDDFRIKHNQLLSEYGVTFENNCDFMPGVTGNIYRKEDDFVCHIKGIRYDDEGDWYGDLDGYLKLLEKELSNVFNKS